ncbi:VOC family protein [Nocardioides sp. zg-DK7169]|uniref:VOC family protein n=1 Tax=Nocardioides sp. zg-DK7169 TaxID=2736600 RepID=UPI0015517580|nr:VOC family protein [Nocardioides sp. zg-DK7169]NPC96453.1 VOC family protein [Nocardioides sp. zg-DK7169]
MSLRLTSYLGFPGTAREAMELYRDVLGGELQATTFAEVGQSDEPGERDKIMHAVLETPDGFVLMGADHPAGTDRVVGNAHSVSLSGEDDARLRGWWERLSDGGTVVLPLTTAPWGDAFGMCTDRYGTSWMVNISSRGQSG